MRLSLCATALACTSLFEQCTAVPSFKSSALGDPSLEQRGPEAVKKRDDAADQEALKYFHEPGHDENLGHYDGRFFHGIVTNEERSETQSHMMRAYLNFFREKGLDTWIAHGTLLGWWWNGKRLPWDSDLDTQVSHATLHQLGQMYNQTKYKYTSPDGKVGREFLLDVNPWIWQRDRGDGMNVIDARWIDMRNGLFIDITGLSETQPQAWPGVWHCKNWHMYRVEELYPMRETTFEGVSAKVPYAYDKILIEEYEESALMNTKFHGHLWDKELKEWVKSPALLKEEEEWRQKQETERQKAALEHEKLG